MKKYQTFYLKILIFLGENFSIYLNRHVFVMVHYVAIYDQTDVIALVCIITKTGLYIVNPLKPCTFI